MSQRIKVKIANKVDFGVEKRRICHDGIMPDQEIGRDEDMANAAIFAHTGFLRICRKDMTIIRRMQAFCKHFERYFAREGSNWKATTTNHLVFSTKITYISNQFESHMTILSYELKENGKN